MNHETSVPTPSAIVRHLDAYVIGQEEAKKAVAVAVYAHYRKIDLARRSGSALSKSNLLLVGPSGTGKTLLCETLAGCLGVPFVTASATSLAQTRYVNDEIEAMLRRLADKAGGDDALAARGIVFIDEIDKLRAPAGESRGTSGENVQHALLKIMEGTPVKLEAGRFVDTTDILFICGGAFVGLEQIMAQGRSLGYIGASGADDEAVLDRLNRRIKPTDLFEFGLIPEFTGRLPVVARFDALGRDRLVRIMTEPTNAIYRQYVDILRDQGVELTVATPVFEQIADIALEYKTGARGLRGVFEEMMAPVLFQVPDHPEIRRVSIDSLFAPPRYFRS